MENTMKYKIIAVLLLVSLVVFGLVSSASAASRFDEVVSRFSNVFVHAGDIEHEHKFTFNGGMAALFAEGRGDLGGTHQAWSTASKTTSPVRRSTAHSTATYFTTTAADALPGQYMTMISGGNASSDHEVQSGVRPNPGASGYIRETVSSSSEAGKGTYSEHSSNVGTSSGTTRMETSTDVSSSVVNVEGFSAVYESVVIDAGGPKTGWWSQP
jgi:hypothetical protein